MFARRSLLKVGAAALFAPTLTTAQANGDTMGGPKILIVLVPHPDDEVLSMWPAMHYLACGYDVHFVYMTRGEVTAASLKIDANATACGWADHGYKHDPVREQYTVPTKEEIGLARLAEGRSCIGAMAAISPVAPNTPGVAYQHDENLGSQFGSNYSASSTAPVVPEAVDKAEAVIRRYAADYPGAIFWSMSPTDDHCDHGAIGQALRRLKGTPHVAGGVVTYTGGDPVLSAQLEWSRFFVSKLYWGTASSPRPADVAAEPVSWYPNPPGRNDMGVPRSAEYTAWLRTKVIKAYTAWNPAQGSFAVGGGHSTPSQFASCFSADLPYGVSALWHP